MLIITCKFKENLPLTILYVGYAVQKLLDVNAIIGNLVTSDRYTYVVLGSALFHCHSWRERFVFLYIACTSRA